MNLVICHFYQKRQQQQLQQQKSANSRAYCAQITETTSLQLLPLLLTVVVANVHEVAQLYACARSEFANLLTSKPS